MYFRVLAPEIWHKDSIAHSLVVVVENRMRPVDDF